MSISDVVFLSFIYLGVFRFMGGNSTKATSGINGAGTQTQQEAGIPDNAKIFFEDTKKSVCSSLSSIPSVTDITVIHRPESLREMISSTFSLVAPVTPSTGCRTSSVSTFPRLLVSVDTHNPVPTEGTPNSPVWSSPTLKWNVSRISL